MYDSNNNTTTAPPHVVLVPLMAQGHTIPMLDMARLLAQRGVHVTFITTPVNASRIKPIIARVHESKLPINFIEIPFPCAEAGLPIGCENFDLVPSIDLFVNFFQAIQLFAHPLEQSLKDLVPRPTCMINDMSNPWAANVARSLNIRTLIFHGPSCVYIYCSYVFQQHKIYETVTDEFEEISVPGLADNDDDDVVGQSFKVCKLHAPGWLNAPGFEKFRDEILHAEETTDGVVMNTFHDVEPMFVEAYKKVIGKDVWTVGPLCLYDKDDLSARIERGNKAAVDSEKLFGWLDSMEERSVLYVSFGSLTRMNVGQILEIGSGLEASGVPLLWVIKDVEKSPEVEEWLKGFEQRMSLRSFVIKGWAPQAAILSHKSVGGFVSHCGWNSTLEAISNGVPMITWPQFADQFLNGRLVVELLRIGIAIGVKKPAFYYGKDEIPVKKDDVERAVRRSLMGDGEEAEERRIRAIEIKKKAIKAMEEGGSSYKNITRLVEYIKHEPGKDVQGTQV
ncbi:UDP-glycosyltransferase 73E1-like [Dioscorea cayenensis subsp. rotundata]|uniref:Glycosyltransferase n=1 Tax=Dioscorea cayennensis subsp. rotundata TaxID=55577 RepID=A0AB40CXG9_DIOCR|nr:UDP-glycosyltransferase 73E1-like [Dioscorea cayenensis subsp. rotundata]